MESSEPDCNVAHGLPHRASPEARRRRQFYKQTIVYAVKLITTHHQ
ncbi:hypothetical protein [Calothrix sp. CCY 0018]